MQHFSKIQKNMEKAPEMEQAAFSNRLLIICHLHGTWPTTQVNQPFNCMKTSEVTKDTVKGFNYPSVKSLNETNHASLILVVTCNLQRYSFMFFITYCLLLLALLYSYRLNHTEPWKFCHVKLAFWIVICKKLSVCMQHSSVLTVRYDASLLIGDKWRIGAELLNIQI